jgi:hypothetical protein
MTLETYWTVAPIALVVFCAIGAWIGVKLIERASGPRKHAAE